MKFSASTLSAIFCSMLAVATAAPEGYVVGDVWSTLTPEAKIPSDYSTDYQTTFGIAIEPVVSSVELTSVSSTSTSPESSYASSISESRDYSKIITQIGDGQIQAPSSTPVAIITQIGDGQIQATTSTPSPTSSVAVITQIGDGQIQAATTTTTTSSSSSTTDVDVITQIGDGQIQAQHSSSSSSEEIVYLTKTENDVVTKYTTYCPEEESSTSSFEGDVTETRTDTVDVDDLSTTFLSTSTTTIYPSSASTSSDDDVTTLTTTPTTTVMVVLTAFYDDPQMTTVSDSTTTSASASASPSASPSSSLATTSATAIPSKRLFKKDVTSQSCMSEGSLAMTIKDSVLTDIKGRIGSIVANRQFQFDGPPPQAGAIYAAGWSVSPDGYLALGNQTIFYQCLSGTFYNLYDEIIGGQCEAVRFGVVNLIDC
ncbi:hypothetical protein B5S31_g1934 [[Candida] boidinii]|uniref:Unnamed protein product n=1 Tax=Candida boidinii TaxID=5477 RepID=A0ACB5TL33_CANBO|nr:hypothetical protein B5S29_g2543 [[Candida] boidinii]OWB72227.1 hypothetical protein B5S31_g1934 [[Candida] boidinii]GME90385.1 unnamed protein product [[Candida] boidinii]